MEKQPTNVHSKKCSNFSKSKRFSSNLFRPHIECSFNKLHGSLFSESPENRRWKTEGNYQVKCFSRKLILLNSSCRHTENNSHKPVDNFLPKIPKQFLPRSKNMELQKLQKKTDFSTNDPLNLLNAALRAVVNFIIKSLIIFRSSPNLKLKEVQ